MNREMAGGPSATAEWTNRFAGTEVGSPQIQVLADTARPDLSYVLPKIPQLVYESAGRPVLSLSLVLRRRPELAEDNIFPLIDSGSLALDLTLALHQQAEKFETTLPLYARKAQFCLARQGAHGGPPVTIAEATGQGADVRVGLAASLDAESAQAVLTALQRGESKLTLSCHIVYRTAESRLRLHLKAQWAAVYDFLRELASPGDRLTLTQLRDQVIAMARADILHARRVEASGLDALTPETNDAAVWEAFSRVRAVLLDSADKTPDEAPTFMLRDRPPDSMQLDMRLDVSTGSEGSVDLSARLEEVIGGALDGFNADTFIHLLYVDAERGAPQPVPQRISASATRGGPGDTASRSAAFATVNGEVVSLERALRPDMAARPTAHMLLASDAVRPQAGLMHTFATSEFAILPIQIAILAPSLPIVDDPATPLWADNANAGRFWYAPDFHLDSANPAADPDSSTYQFTFKETGHDDQGRPVLEGEVLFTVVRGIGAETRAALEARSNPRADAVPTNGLSASLVLPVRDDTGQLRQVNLGGTIQDKGATIEVRVPLQNNYLRVAYGDLAIAGFQPNNTQLTFAYTFDAMVPSQTLGLQLQYVGKLQMIPVARSHAAAKEFGDIPYIDAARVAYRSPVADLLYQREAPARDAEVEAPSTAARGVALATAPVLHAVSLNSHMPIAVAAPFHPELTDAVHLHQMVAERQRVRGSVGRVIAMDALFPCNTLGAFYRQDLGDRQAAVGCQSTLSLGQTDLKMFELIDDAAVTSPHYKVYRSLSQPGHFLILPTEFRITRYASTEAERAYRPAIYMYSSLDAEDAANNRCVIMASLQPHLPTWVRKNLTVKLAALHHQPVVQFICEIDSEVSYTWSLDGGASTIEPGAAKLWDGFQVTLSSDLTGGLQMQAILRHGGIAAEAQFKLQDGTKLSSTLNLNLADLTGPWASGPIETIVNGMQATVTNHIERHVNVSDIDIYGAEGQYQQVPVESLLAPAGSVSVDLPFTAVEAYPLYEVQPGAAEELSEVSSFVEDIHTNVVFVNLINYANHDLQRLDVKARLKEATGSETTVEVSEDDPVGEADFTVPLTTYLGPRTLQFQATKIDTGGHAMDTSWLEWDLGARGNVVSLTWDLISA
jgi:hypothetical protein